MSMLSRLKQAELALDGHHGASIYQLVSTPLGGPPQLMGILALTASSSLIDQVWHLLVFLVASK